MENKAKGTNLMTETVVEIVSIVVTLIGIFVTLTNTIQSCKKHKHQKSNRRSPK